MNPRPPAESQSLLDQGEQLLDSSRQLLANLDDALKREVWTESDADAAPGLDEELSA